MIDQGKPNIVVTGISGDLGRRLLPQLANYRVTGIDLHPPKTEFPLSFVKMDLGLEDSCRELLLLIRELRPVAFIHLAFVMQPRRGMNGSFSQMWQVNVSGTARVMEALSEANRDEDLVKKLVFLSCVAAYGPNSAPASEDTKLAAHTLPYAIQKMEADQTVLNRATTIRGCSVYVLRTAALAGATVGNLLIRTFRGASGKHKASVNSNIESRGIPYMLPWGKKYLDKQIQFVHVDDAARLIANILRRPETESREVKVINVAGRGEPLSRARCIEIARAKVFRVPGLWLLGKALDLGEKMNGTSLSAASVPYLTENQVVSTARLQEFLGAAYPDVIQYTNAEAFADCFRQVAVEAHKD